MPVINKYHYNNSVPPGAINIMRGSVFGNPYKISKDMNREDVVLAYKKYLWKRIHEDPEFASQVASLRDRTLCCCCAPLTCHGDVLLACAEWMHKTNF